MNLMIKPVSGHCNLDCRYCFYKAGHTQGHAMTAQDARTLLGKVLPYIAAGYPLVFQGGEPLLAGHDYFEAVFSLLDAHGLQVPVFIQTNGTLLDARFTRLFAEHHALVGVSLDGTRETHGAYRPDFDRVMDGIRCLREAGCEFNVLTVVTDALAARVDDVWAFYREQDFGYQQYIPCMAPPGAAPDRHLSSECYGAFLCRLFDLWKADYDRGRYVYVRFFENILLLLSGYPAEDCGAGGICSPQFLIESDGSVYPCDFYVAPEYRLGNLHTDTPEALERRLLRTDFISSSVALPESCAACRYVHLCRGGCKRYRDSGGRFIHCEAYRRFFDHALKPMLALLDARFGEKP